MSVDNNKNMKCAPGKQFEDGSCISLDLLIEMAKAYNTHNKNSRIELNQKMEMLNRSKYKLYLLDQFKEKLKASCGENQVCWTEQSYINYMNNESQKELQAFTFRPKGPKGKFEWLNTLNINDVMNQYQVKYTDFKFLGAVPIDFDNIYKNIRKINIKALQSEGIYKIGIVFNLDESWKSGSHWVALFTNTRNGEIYYFDSYGIRPEFRIRKLVRRIANQIIELKNCNLNDIKVEYNDIRHQYGDSECGMYSLNFIERMLDGETFDEICHSKVPDAVVNSKRKEYFI